jgi:hypothetical protein
MRGLFFTLSTIALFGCIVTAEIRAPRIGMVRQLDGKIRPVFGVPANLICGNAWDIQSVAAAAFSDQAGLVLAGNRLFLQTLDGAILGAVEVSEPNPLLGIESSPETAAAWLPSSGKLLTWDGRSFVEARLDLASLPGKPAAIRRAGINSVEFLLDVGDGSVARAVVSTSTGAVLQLTTLPGLSEPAFATSSSVVGQDHHQLVVQFNDGSRQTLPISGADLAFQKPSSNWLVVSSKAAGRQWLVHIDKAGVSVSELPQGLDSFTTAHSETAR